MANLEAIATPAQKRALTAEIKAHKEHLEEARSCVGPGEQFFWFLGTRYSVFYIKRLEWQLASMMKRRAKMNTNVKDLNY